MNRLSDPQNVQERDVAFAPFDLPHVGAINLGIVGHLRMAMLLIVSGSVLKLKFL